MEPTCQPVRFDGPVQWDAVPAGDPEWTYALNRHTIFVNLGRAWRLTGRVRYLDAFAALLADWLSRVPHTPASESSTWRALEAGLRPENWLRAAALFGQALPEELRCRMEESLAEHGAYLEKAHGPFQRLSNWGAIQAHGLFLIGLRLGRADWQDLALARLTENLRHAVGPDGVQWEQSPMYHCEVLHAALDTLLLAGQNGRTVPPELAEKAPALRLEAGAAGTAALVWVLSLGGTCQAELLPVTTGAGEPVAPSAAGAVRIRRDGQTCTVLFSWQAGAHEAGLLCAGGCEVHGCTAVFTPQHPQGLCLD